MPVIFWRRRMSIAFQSKRNQHVLYRVRKEILELRIQRAEERGVSE